MFHQTHNSTGNCSSNAFFYTDRIWKHHFHKNPELIYVLEGSVECSINGTSHALSAGDFGLCLPYDVHSYIPAENTRYWVLVFSMEYIRHLEGEFSSKVGKGFRFRCPEPVEQYIRSRLVHEDASSVLTMKSCLYALCEQYLQQVPLTEKKTSGLRSAAFIAQYVQEHHRDKLTLSQLAQELGYDYSYMSRYFHSTFHMPFSDFVGSYRLETALKLLEAADISITDAALESGFQSIRSFQSYFQKHMGMTPSQYRKAPRR